jgi:DUF1680 family protein
MLSEIPHGQALITGGFWGRRQQVNRTVSLTLGHQRLEEAGNLENLREAARGETRPPQRGLPVFDSDIYKWLEAVGWELGREPDQLGPPFIRDLADDVIKTLRAAQSPDGYVGSWHRVSGTRFSDMLNGLELYCAGHLFEAAVAWQRGAGDDRLLTVARRFADHIGTVFGPGRRAGIPEHPGIEMALVQLFRATGDERYLQLGQFFFEQRGHASLSGGLFGPRYRQDEMPFRQARSARGHAVMNAYLACGALDIFAETGDRELLEAAVAQWEDMVSCRMYVTGGTGSRHKEESFGDPFELPPDRAYCETCAAVGVVMWSWRLLLATGEPRFADVIERVLWNAFAVGVSLDGRRYFYVNPLQVRAGHADAEDGRGRAARSDWYEIACCPPNVMRTLSSLERYFATTSGDGIQIWQFAPMRLAATVADQPLRLTVRTDYPGRGRVSVRVDEAGLAPVELALRIPAWASGARGWLEDTGQHETSEIGGEPSPGALWRVRRRWRTGDELMLDLPMPSRMTVADPRVDAVRGCVAVERGPLVYCLEEADLTGPQQLESTRLSPGTVFRAESLDISNEPVTTLVGEAQTRPLPAASGVPYYSADHANVVRPAGAVRLVPYGVWGNRDPGQTMRVWIPTT